uniref:SERTA domain-containing protein 2-like n=1 Tax=Cyanistes caeruleus TaxID=156563 RepID=A0A8C0V1N8_CYACU
MLGRGLKRKLSDYEENMAGLSSAFDSSRGLPYPLKRQLVLNMCLTKLQTYKMLVEPNLHRSVLIANTVRQIQEEMRQESNQQPVNICPGIAPASHSYTGMESPGISLQLPSGVGQQESHCCDLRSFPENTGLKLEDDRQDLKGAECVFGSFEISNSTSYLKDLAIDDIFEDIDTSMYDSDFCCPPLMPTDLSELDHIMEILVGS